MIQFNLLPDVKIEYIKTRNRKRLIVFVCLIASAVCLAIFLLLFLFVRVNQTRHISNLDSEIKDSTAKIQEVNDLDKILTIQNQLNKLPELHDKKVISSRLVDFLTQITPNQASISDVGVDFEANTMKLSGTADNLVTINKFADTLKFTDFTVDSQSGKRTGKAFSSVVLTNFTIKSTQGEQLTYELSFNFDPAIFMQVKDAPENSPQVLLTVPAITSTRSATEKPNQLFVPAPEVKPEGGTQ